MKWTWINVNKFFWIVSVMIILASTGCKKFVHVDEPDDSLTTAVVFSNDSLAQAAVTGLYIKIMSSTKFLLNGGMSLLPGLSADELQRTSSLVTEDPFYNNSINPNNLLVNANLWKAAYAYIYQCNISIEGLQKSTGVSAIIKRQLQGEALFVRALCYYYLVNLYGDVPLVLGTNADINTMLLRSSIDVIYQQIETDLTAANDLLLADKPYTRPSKYAVQALLARVYLYRKNWSKAEEMASAVINSGQFALVRDLTGVFKSDSKETIFQLAPVSDKMNSGEGFIFVQSSPNVRPAYILTTGLLNAFETGDLRKSTWIKTVTLSQQTYNYPFKYRVYLSNTVSEYNVVLRLAEQYLIRAEARAYQNKIEDAVIDINAIRIRAGLPVLSISINSDECLQRIEQERRVELFAEWGHRWFDLKRTNRANAVLGVIKGSNWNTEDQLYPIPATELETAPYLKQNPGYD
jgi:hypothetical protein